MLEKSDFICKEVDGEGISSLLKLVISVFGTIAFSFLKLMP